MAIYQITIELIPQMWAINNNYDAAGLYEDKQYDPSTAWRNNLFKKDFASIISKVLPKRNSWHPNLDIWGDSEYNDIQIFWNENKKEIEAFTIRLDLRDDIENILKQIRLLAITLDCVLFFPESKKIIRAEDPMLQYIIDNSNAARWVKNPKKYLENPPI